jgi:hypothetical protein
VDYFKSKKILARFYRSYPKISLQIPSLASLFLSILKTFHRASVFFEEYLRELDKHQIPPIPKPKIQEK